MSTGTGGLEDALIRILAASALAAFLWSVFRLAMGLRYSKIAREASRRDEEAAGRRIAAEIPGAEGDLTLFLEDAEGFYWRGSSTRKSGIVGVRLLLNGLAVGAASRGGAELPPLDPLPEDDGSERWEVRVDLTEGGVWVVPCGRLREGVSREIAARVYEAVRRSVTGP
jgi:hypothetical protein